MAAITLSVAQLIAACEYAGIHAQPPCSAPGEDEFLSRQITLADDMTLILDDESTYTGPTVRMTQLPEYDCELLGAASG